jgi:hypothetical protein
MVESFGYKNVDCKLFQAVNQIILDNIILFARSAEMNIDLSKMVDGLYRHILTKLESLSKTTPKEVPIKDK